jgi:hypothetical protein
MITSFKLNNSIKCLKIWYRNKIQCNYLNLVMKSIKMKRTIWNLQKPAYNKEFKMTVYLFISDSQTELNIVNHEKVLN